MSVPILITGASGAVGGRVARLLAAQGLPLRLLIRDPLRSPGLRGAEIAIGDYADPHTLPAAFAGIDIALIVSGYAEPGKRALLHKSAIEAAAAAGVKHLVYLSFQGASAESKFPFARDHYMTEQYLRESGVDYTALRDNLYLDMIGDMFSDEGVVRGPAAQGAVAWVSRDDVARVAAAALTDPQPASATYDVTGAEALTLAQTAQRLSAMAGRELRYEEETVEEGREWRSQLDAAAWEVDVWLGSYEAIAAGELDTVSDTVQRFTGSAPMSLEQFFSQTSRALERLKSRIN